MAKMPTESKKMGASYIHNQDMHTGSVGHFSQFWAMYTSNKKKKISNLQIHPSKKKKKTKTKTFRNEGGLAILET